MTCLYTAGTQDVVKSVMTNDHQQSFNSIVQRLFSTEMVVMTQKLHRFNDDKYSCNLNTTNSCGFR